MSLTNLSNERSMLSMVILAVFAMGVVVFLLKMASNVITEATGLNDQPAYLGTKTVIKNPSSTFEGWKDYNDRVFGFKMKYPEGLRPDFEKTSPFITGTTLAHLFLQPAIAPDDRLSGNTNPTLGFYIAIFPISQKASETGIIAAKVKNAYNVYEFRANLIPQMKELVVMYRLTSTLGTHYIAYFDGGNYFFEVAASGDYDTRQVQDFISTFSFD